MQNQYAFISLKTGVNLTRKGGVSLTRRSGVSLRRKEGVYMRGISRIVKNMNINKEQSVKINLEGLSSGLYMLETSTEKGNVLNKFIIE